MRLCFRICTNVVAHLCERLKNNIHYENMPMQYLEIFHSCKKDNFQTKNIDIFLIFALNIDYGYTLEPHQ